MAFVFNNTEEKWFVSWVVMRRKFLKSQENVRELIKDVNYWRNKSYELEKINKDLLVSRRKEGVSDFEKQKAEKRQKMIDDFNRKNNKGRTFNKKRKNRRR